MENQGPQILGHPKGVFVCALTEMWERFSFYGMKFLLVLYVTKYHLFTDAAGLDVLGGYAALVYAVPVIGGLLADRYLGMRKAVVLGGILLCLGHLGMAYEGTQAYSDASGNIVRDGTAIQTFYLSLGLIIMGVGFLKPNISTIVGRLYEENDPRRDSGFTIFYMGINLGSFAATMACGYLGETYGWRYGFGLAGIGMIAGLIIFLWGQKFLFGHADPPDEGVLKEKVLMGAISREALIYIGSIGGVFICYQLVQFHVAVKWSLILTSAAFIVGLTWFLITQCDRIERHRMMVLVVLTASTVVFWALFEQAGASMTLFADRVLDREFMGFEPTAAQFGSLNAGFIILLAPVFAWLWVKLAKRKLEPNTPIKFGLGIVQVGLGFGMLVFGAQFPDESGKVAMIWLVLAYLLHTTGELCLSPVGLSAVTKLAVPRVVGVMMGAWFLATAASEFVAAQLSKIAALETTAGEVDDIGLALTTYTGLFNSLLWTGVIVGVALLLISPLLRKGMHGIH